MIFRNGYSDLKSFQLAIALGPDVDIADRDQVWFHLLANVDPIGDRVDVGLGMGLDATPRRPGRPRRAFKPKNELV